MPNATNPATTARIIQRIAAELVLATSKSPLFHTAVAQEFIQA